MPKLSSSSSSSSHHFGSLPWWLLSALRAAKMKGKAYVFLKQVASVLTSIVKAKSAAVKNKASAVKAKLIIFGLLHDRKVLMSAISHKIHALVGQAKEDVKCKAIVVYDAAVNEEPLDSTDIVELSGGKEAAIEEVGEVDDGYPDLRHSLFDEEDDEVGDEGTGPGSIIDLVKNSRGEDQGEFVLEDEIDHVAELFIRRFHRQMRLQRLESFKRYQKMMEKSA